MNTEYVVGKIRIGFESQARRRWFVALCYAALTVLDLVWSSVGWKGIARDWTFVLASGLAAAVLIILSRIAGEMRSRGDEREMSRRDHAHYIAYYSLAYGLVGALFAGYFRGPNPVTPLLPLALRRYLLELPSIILGATIILYCTLPRAILLWTEPDMEQPQ